MSATTTNTVKGLQTVIAKLTPQQANDLLAYIDRKYQSTPRGDDPQFKNGMGKIAKAIDGADDTTLRAFAIALRAQWDAAQDKIAEALRDGQAVSFAIPVDAPFVEQPYGQRTTLNEFPGDTKTLRGKIAGRERTSVVVIVGKDEWLVTPSLLRKAS